MSEKDRETRARLLDAATRLFAASGFDKVTVRDICQSANANVALVNYHFGDKMGLYREVLKSAIDVMCSTTELARSQGEGRSAEEKLDVYVRVFIDRVVKHGRDSWIHQLMMHEMSAPTSALDLVVDHVLRPRMAYLGEIVADILDCDTDDDRVMRGALSVQSQLQLVMKNPIAQRLARDVVESAGLDEMAAHITTFSLGGIRAMTVRTPVAVRARKNSSARRAPPRR